MSSQSRTKYYLLVEPSLGIKPLHQYLKSPQGVWLLLCKRVFNYLTTGEQ